MTLLLAYVGMSLAVSFTCSVLEAVLLCATPLYIAQLEEQRPRVGARLRALRARVDRSLAAILTLNTVAHTIGAAGAGAQAQALWGSEIVTAASVVLTVLILIFSEIIPKTLGATYWKELGPVAATVVPAMIALTYPFVLLSEQLSKLLGQKSSEGAPSISREEVAMVTRLAEEQGVVAAAESRIIKNLLRFSEIRAKDIMTPRTVLVSVPDDTPVRRVLEEKTWLRFSRIPVWGDNEDDVVGYVLKDEVLLNAARDRLDRPVGEFKRELLTVPGSLPVPGLFERLLQSLEHIALVVDEYGGVAGVVTLEDIMETLLGMEIVDEVDAVQDMRALARRKWFARARKLGIAPEEDLAAMEREPRRASDRP